MSTAVAEGRPSKSALASRIAAVEARLEQACARAGRPRSSVRLIAVSKRHPAEVIQSAAELGLTDFGENYVQELVEKCEQLEGVAALRFHAIGHLQRNKVRALIKVAKACAELSIHTADGEVLIAELQKRASAEDVRLNVYIEVNVAHETQKSGCAPERVPHLVESVEAASHLTLQGLMAIPPSSAEAEAARPHFALLRQLGAQYCPLAPRLSMGMSHDFEVAVEEGATDVRVGTAIFGPRGVPAP